MDILTVTARAPAEAEMAGEPAFWMLAALYLAVLVGIAAWTGRRTRSAEDFFVAGRRIGLLTLTLSAMSASLSGFAFIGGPGLVYAFGLGAMFLILPVSINHAMASWVLAKRLRVLGETHELLTVPDAIGVRYRSQTAQGLAGAAILVGVIGYLATNLLALGLLLSTVLDVRLGTGIWIGAAVILSYSIAGGMLAGVYVDVMQGALMLGSSLLLFMLALDAGGGLTRISGLLLAAEADFLGPWGMLSPMTVLSFYLVFSLGSLGQPHVIHKFYMIRDVRLLRWYPLTVTTAAALTTLVVFGVGVTVKALTVEGTIPPLAIPDDATPVFLLTQAPLALASIVFAGVGAAIVGTMHAFVNVGAAAVTHDLPLAVGRRFRNELRVGRIATGLIVFSAGLLAQLSGTLVAFLGIFGWGLFACTLVPALAIGLNWKGATREGAIASIVTGLLVTLVAETLAFFGAFRIPDGVTVSAFALVLSMLVFLVGSWLTRARVSGEIAMGASSPRTSLRTLGQRGRNLSSRMRRFGTTNY